MRKDKRKKRKKKSFGKILLTLMMLLIFGAGVAFGYFIHLNGGGLQGLLATILGQTPGKLEDLDPINVLILRNK